MIELTEELEMNYDMFVHEDGYDRIDTCLTGTELNREKLANWAYR